MTKPLTPELAALLKLIEQSASKTIHAVELERNRSGVKAYFKAYLGGRDITYELREATGMLRERGPVDRWGTLYMRPQLSLTTDSGEHALRDVLASHGIDPSAVKMTSAALRELKKSDRKVVEGTVIEAVPYVGSHGAAMFRAVVLTDEGEAYQARFNHYQKLERGSIAPDMPDDRPDRAWAGGRMTALQNARIQAQGPVRALIGFDSNGDVALRFGATLERSAFEQDLKDGKFEVLSLADYKGRLNADLEAAGKKPVYSVRRDDHVKMVVLVRDREATLAVAARIGRRVVTEKLGPGDDTRWAPMVSVMRLSGHGYERAEHLRETIERAFNASVRVLHNPTRATEKEPGR